MPTKYWVNDGKPSRNNSQSILPWVSLNNWRHHASAAKSATNGDTESIYQTHQLRAHYQRECRPRRARRHGDHIQQTGFGKRAILHAHP